MRKGLRRALLILVVAGAVIAVALAIAQDQATLRLRSAVAAADRESAVYVAALTGSPVTEGNTFEVLNDGDEVYPAMLAAMGQARRRIVFETFFFEQGEVADRFIEAFVQAAARGVAVHIIVDFVGASGMSDASVARLRDAGCRVSSFNELRWYDLEEMNYRTHRKILVVDGQLAFTGGLGIADHWLGRAQDPDHWHDVMVQMRGPVARLLEAAFYENALEERGGVTPMLDLPPQRPPAESSEGGTDGAGSTDASSASDRPSGATLIVRSEATGGSSDMKRMYLLLIASARRTLDIGSPYFVTDESSEWAIDEAVRRGVRVRILTEGEHTDSMPVKYASRRAYERLLAKGLDIYEYAPTMYHTKMMIVDDAWSMFGSANFDNRSLELNDELNVAVHDADLAARFSRIFDEDLQRATRLHLDTWRRRPILEKARERFWGYWGEIF